MAYIPSQLQEIASKVRAGERPTIESVKVLLGWYRAQRRSPHVVQQIQAALLEVGLETIPGFESAYLDGELSFAPARATEATTTGGRPDTPTMENIIPDQDSDPTFRIGRLAAANKKPESVPPGATMENAFTLMMELDFSQLPVMQSERTVKGMVTWQSIATALALGSECRLVQQCMIPHYEISAERSLFAAIPMIIEHGYVLIRGTTERISGIVTATDLSLQFMQLAEPFLRLSEIENHIRKLISSCIPLEQMKGAKNPADTGREVRSAADLSFGEYLRLLESDENWPLLSLRIDRKHFLTQLETIRKIRNDVMHFDPDGIAPDDETHLRNFVHLLQTLARYRSS